MGAGYHGGFGATKGKQNAHTLKMNLQLFASKAFEKGGHVSAESLSKHGLFFLGKSARRVEHELNKQGYKTRIEPSKNPKSKAKKIVIENSSKEKNISTVLVSPGSRRHGDTPYVKISTKDQGRFKVVSNREEYKTDGSERARIYFARRKRK